MEGLDLGMIKEFTGLGISGALLFALLLLAKWNGQTLRDISKEQAGALREVNDAQEKASERISECLRDVAVAQKEGSMHVAEMARAVDRLAGREKP